MARGLMRLLAAAWLVFSLHAQSEDYSFYMEFRNFMAANSQPGGGPARRIERVLPQYVEKLSKDGVSAGEIDRRKHLLTTKYQELENYYWNVVLTNPNAAFNKEANSFLIEMTKNRKPGKAIDVGAGECRNAIYLAARGWQVTALDPADQALALGLKRARAAGLDFKTVIDTEQNFDFGRDQWDLILFSWTNPTAAASKIVDSLSPGGVVVFEGAAEWHGPNGLLKMFPGLRLIHYEDVLAKSDFFARREMQIVRYAAVKMR